MKKKKSEVSIGEVDRWSDLPKELLLLILGRLPFLDLLACLGVCRGWRAVIQNHPPRRSPWFMCLNKAKGGTTYDFIDSSTRCNYTIDIPELRGTQHILSRHGWLLLCSSSSLTTNCLSLFFLHPFSRARIDLPYLDICSTCEKSDSKWPDFSISASPTSQDCILFAIFHIDNYNVSISICRQGEDAWTTNHYSNREFKWISNVVFIDGLFYCMDKHGSFCVFDAENFTWRYLKGSMGRARCMVYPIKRNGKVVLCVECYKGLSLFLLDKSNNCGLPKELQLSNDEECWSLIDLEGKWFAELPKEIELDTVCGARWCTTGKSDDGKNLFHWHSVIRHECEIKCVFSQGVWIEPTWIQPLPSIQWVAR